MHGDEINKDLTIKKADQNNDNNTCDQKKEKLTSRVQNFGERERERARASSSLARSRKNSGSPARARSLA